MMSRPPQRHAAILVVILLLLVGCSGATLPAKGPAAYLELVRPDPVRLEAFVRDMPKGGDLHTHLSGVAYAESYLRYASEDDKCISTASWATKNKPCPEGYVKVRSILADPKLVDQAIDAFSVRNAPLAPPRFAHDHFFATFDLFNEASKGHTHDMLAEAVTRADRDNTQYLELLHTLFPESLGTVVKDEPWNGDIEAWYAKTVEPIRALVRSQIAELDAIISKERALLACQGPAPPTACTVTVRFIQQVIRTMPDPSVFASLILGAELARQDPRIVGVDLVAPEDDPVALANYSHHMQMLGFLKKRYPALNINLHAGELTSAFASPENLTFHVTQAVRTAGARRLGHGVAIKSEPDWQGLMAEMARNRVGVALLFTSNAQILGVTGDAHPFRSYEAAGVPVMISTDDQGVSRGSHTGEFLRAITTYALPWDEVKKLVRASLDLSFLAGFGLWKTPGVYASYVDQCAANIPGGRAPSPSCKAFLDANDKAAEQWRLEGRLAAFEKRYQ